MLEVCGIKFSISDRNFSLTFLERDVLLSMASLNPVEFLKQAHSNLQATTELLPELELINPIDKLSAALELTHTSLPKLQCPMPNSLGGKHSYKHSSTLTSPNRQAVGGNLIPAIVLKAMEDILTLTPPLLFPTPVRNLWQHSN